MKTISRYLFVTVVIAIFAGILTWLVLLLVLGRPVLLNLVSQIEMFPRWLNLAFAAAFATVPNWHQIGIFSNHGLREWTRELVSLPCSAVAGLILGCIEIWFTFWLVPSLPAGFQPDTNSLPTFLLLGGPCLVAGFVVRVAVGRATSSLSN